MDKNKILFDSLNEGDHLISNRGPYKSGRTIKCRKSKFKTMKIPLTVVKNFYCGVIRVKVDVNLYGFKSG